MPLDDADPRRRLRLRLAAAGTTSNAELRCVELATGKVMWSEPDLTRTSLLLVDGHFVCLGEDGVLRLLKVNPKKYEEVASVQLRKTNKNGEPDENSRPLLSDRECWAARCCRTACSTSAARIVWCA